MLISLLSPYTHKTVDKPNFVIFRVSSYLAPTPYKGEAIQTKPAYAGYKTLFFVLLIKINVY